METNLKNKYKDNTPEQTIKNIQDFFNNKGYSVEVEKLNEPVKGIWWCRINLKYNNIFLTGSNGKGTSKEFALASGYSELYERYCCLFNSIINSKINNKKLYSICKKEKGYLFHDEKFLSIEEAIRATPQIEDFCKSINDDQNSLVRYLELNNPDGLISLPFKGFNLKDSINIPFELMKWAHGTSGMAAGNSLEEAITQSCSELCEHYVCDSIFFEKRPFSYLNLKTQSLPDYINNFLKRLDDSGYKYYIYDFSYLYNLPVVGLLIVDQKNYISYLNLGSSPVFSIALERCCTEIFQGCSILNDTLKRSMEPTRINNIYNLISEETGAITLGTRYPENLILNSVEITNYNSEVFLEDNLYSNIKLNNYYKNLFNNNSWEIYYRDFSQSKYIKTVWCFVKNIPIKNAAIKSNYLLSPLVKERKWNITFEWEILIEKYFQNKIIDGELLETIQFWKKIESQDNKKIIIDSNIFRSELMTIPGLNILDSQTNNFDILYTHLLNNNFNQFLKFNKNCEYNKFFFYSFLLLYSGNYSEQEIEQISKFYGINYSEEDYKNKNNIFYYLNKIYFEPYYNYYYSNEYNNLIKTFIPCEM